MGESAGLEYALLTISKWHFERVLYPDGTEEDGPPGSAAAATARWHEEQAAGLRARFDEEVLPGLRSRFETELRAWEAREETREMQAEQEASQEEWLWGRDNTATAPGHARRSPLEAAALGARLNDPKPPERYEQEYEVWRKSQPTPMTTTDLRGWQAVLVDRSGREPIEIEAVKEAEDFRWPESDVIVILNRLADTGWRVMSVTEDKGTYPGADAGAESGPVRVRYLLERSVRSLVVGPSY
jgi:hypothetical protein